MIEIFGPPGAGKTSLYRAATRRGAIGEIFLKRSESAAILSARPRFLRVMLIRFLHSRLQFLERIGIIACHALNERFVTEQLKAIEGTSLGEFALWAMPNQVRLSAASSDLKRALHLLKSLAVHSVIAEAKKADGNYLVDEGILQRGLSLAHTDDEGFAATREYFAKCPLPDVAILLLPERAIIIEQLLKRGENPEYVGATDKLIEASLIASGIIKSRGGEIKILRATIGSRTTGDAFIDLLRAEVAGKIGKVFR